MQAAPLTEEVVGGEQGVERAECVGNSSSDELKIDLIFLHSFQSRVEATSPG